SIIKTNGTKSETDFRWFLLVFIRLNSISTRGGTYFENLAYNQILIKKDFLKPTKKDTLRCPIITLL
ncbi:hypothetical protein DIX43_07195, partial [Streptococcus iniae]